MEDFLALTGKVKIGLLIFFGLYFLVPDTLQAASINFNPAVGSYEVGAVFKVNVYVTSNDRPINAASARISFPAEKLEVVSVSPSGSVFNLWIQEPDFSNARGLISAEGVILDPGYQGNSGKLLNVTFRVKAAGTASLAFIEGLVLASDGEGTNVLESLGSAVFYLGPITSSTVPAVPPTVTFLAIPTVESPTHPDPRVWYNKTTAIFKWPLPADVTGVRLSLDKSPQTVPADEYTPPIAKREISDLTDGTWYFHVRAQNAAGWGPTAHFSVRIDTGNPDFIKVVPVERENQTVPQIKFLFTSGDAVSGVQKYEVRIDEKATVSLANVSETCEYLTPVLPPGRHTIIVKAVDGAGNYVTEAVDFDVVPLISPLVTDYAERIWEGDSFFIQGTSVYPDTQVLVWLKGEEEKTPTVWATKVASNGNFRLVLEEKLYPGVYKFWAAAEDEQGARSLPTEEVSFIVERPGFLRIIGIISGMSSLMWFLVMVFGILSLFIWWLCWRNRRYKKYIDKNIRDSDAALDQTFEVIKDHVLLDATSSVPISGSGKTDGRTDKLTEKLSDDLNSAKNFVKNIIKDINKK